MVGTGGDGSAGPAMPRPAAVQLGGHVVLRDTEGGQKVFHLGGSVKDLRMGKYAPIPIEAVLTMPYGATLRRVEGGKWERHRRCGPAAGEGDKDLDISESNQHLAQDNRAQSLTPTAVKELKGRCTGEELVDALASNSSTFATKTKFSQEKYIRKKQQKHVQQVTILRPTVMELCETYMKQSRGKMCGLRFDYLSSVLANADVRSGGRYFAFDCACGLVVASMAQRLSGAGRVFRAFRGNCPEKALAELDLGTARETVRPVPLEVLQSAEPWAQEWLRPPEVAEDAAKATGEEALVRMEARTERARRRATDLRDLQARPVDAVVVVAGDDDAEAAAEAVDVGLAHLAPSGRLVVYGPHLQPLAARQSAMRAGGIFVDVRLTQLFTREYQVLPQRTHPHMSAEAQLCEGFLLTATKVADSTAGGVCEEPGLAEKRQRLA